MKLRGFEIPQVLPPALKAVLASSGTTTPLSPAPTIGTGMGTPPVRPVAGGVPLPGMAVPGVVSPPYQPGMATPPHLAGSAAQPVQPMVSGMPLIGGVGVVQPMVSGIPAQPMGVMPGMGLPPGAVAATAVPPASLPLTSATAVAGVRPVTSSYDAIPRSASITSHESM